MLSRSVGSVGSRYVSADRLRVFLRFAGLSGLGWLLDMAVLLALVGLLGLPPFLANIASSCAAALSVFLISRLVIFDGARTALGVSTITLFDALPIADFDGLPASASRLL
jgi:putative flippase GtrA